MKNLQQFRLATGLTYKTVFLVIMAAILGVILVQNLFYVFGYKLGRIKIQNHNYLLMNKNKFSEKLPSQLDRKLKINFYNVNGQDSSVWQFKLSDIGVTFSERDAKNSIFKYNPKQSLIPFGWLIFKSEYNISKYYNMGGSITKESIKQKISELSTPAINAKINISEQGDISVTQDSPDINYQFDDVTGAISFAIDNFEDEGSLNPKTTDAPKTKAELEKYIPEISKVLDKKVEFYKDDKSVIVGDRIELASMIEIKEDVEPYGLSFNQEEVKQYLTAKLNPVFGEAPKDTIVNIIDGKEQSRVLGNPGKVVDVTIAADQLISSIISKSEEGKVVKLEAKINEEKPKITYNYSYAKTQEGLDNLVNDLGKKYGDVAISVKELYGSGRASSHQGSQQRVAASTYKLAIAYAVAQKVDKGEMAWDSLVLDKNTDTCLSLMIVNSNNSCAQEWLNNLIGVSNMNQVMASLGMGSSCFGCGYAKSSTDDQLKILSAIYSEQGISSDSSKKILNLMSRQVYRKGIPASTGYGVADKVGFLESYLNDSAIVYTKNGPLLISIYTNGSSWDSIAEISREIIKNCD
jgi:hypothetical protein